MALPATTIEGTWEEILEHSSELAGRRVKLTLLPDAKPAKERPPWPRSKDEKTNQMIEEFAGCWVGDDLDECLEEVYRLREDPW